MFLLSSPVDKLLPTAPTHSSGMGLITGMSKLAILFRTRVMWLPSRGESRTRREPRYDIACRSGGSALAAPSSPRLGDAEVGRDDPGGRPPARFPHLRLMIWLIPMSAIDLSLEIQQKAKPTHRA